MEGGSKHLDVKCCSIGMNGCLGTAASGLCAATTLLGMVLDFVSGKFRKIKQM